MLHYDDAAGACLAALIYGRGRRRNRSDTNDGEKEEEDEEGRLFLVSDGHPTTRKGICESALKSKRWGGETMPMLDENGERGGGGKGKVYDET